MWYENLTKRELIYTLVTRDFMVDNRHREAVQLKNQLALTEKALELACNDMYWLCAFSGKFTKEEFASRKRDYYVKQAKEMMKSE